MPSTFAPAFPSGSVRVDPTSVDPRPDGTSWVASLSISGNSLYLTREDARVVVERLSHILKEGK